MDQQLQHSTTRNDFSPSSSSSLNQVPEPTPISRRPTQVELSRTETSQLHHQSTVGSRKARAPRDEWLPFGDKEFPPDLPDPEKYVVDFAGEYDPLHPHNWPTWRKYVLSHMYTRNTTDDNGLESCSLPFSPTRPSPPPSAVRSSPLQ